MSLQLDGRQRAMLGAMGIRLFEPQPESGLGDGAPPVSPRGAGGQPAPAAGGMAKPPQARPDIELLEWDGLAQAVADCRACGLCETRTRTVFGVGDTQADWLIVGEAPGENEDLQGEPFVGQAGKLLDNMLKALGLDRRSKVYIANVLKCRPPGGNRDTRRCAVPVCCSLALPAIATGRPGRGPRAPRHPASPAPSPRAAGPARR